jgi:hypothetical protein
MMKNIEISTFSSFISTSNRPKLQQTLFKPSKVDKGCAREPKWGLGYQPSAPIGMACAAPKQLDHIAAK